MDALSSINPMTWLIIFAAGAIITLVLFARVIKAALKVAVIVVMLLLVAYFLRQAGII